MNRSVNLIRDDAKFRLVLWVSVALIGFGWYASKVLLLFVHPSWLHADPFTLWFFDLKAYYSAAVALSHGQSIYAGTDFLYPPLTAALFRPLALLSFDQVILVSIVLNISLLAVTGLMISKILRAYSVRLSRQENVLMFTGMFFFYPVGWTITVGQVNILILFLITVAYYYVFVKQNKMIAGLLLSIATVIKVWPAVLALLGLVTPRARGLLTRYGLFMGLFIIISLATFGLSTHLEFVDTLVRHQSLGPASVQSVLSPRSAFSNDGSVSLFLVKLLSLLGLGKYYFIVYALRVLFVLGWAYYLYDFGKRRPAGSHSSACEYDVLMFTSLIILVLIVSNPVWHYYGTYLVLSYVLLLYVLAMDPMEKVLTWVSVFLFSIQQYAVSLGDLLGGVLQAVIHVANPPTLGYIVFLALVIHVIERKKRAVVQQIEPPPPDMSPV